MGAAAQPAMRARAAASHVVSIQRGVFSVQNMSGIHWVVKALLGLCALGAGSFSMAQGPAKTALLPSSGQKIFEAHCAVCHADPFNLAPQISHRPHWDLLRKKHTLEELTRDAIQGEGKMPPRGGNPQLSDEDIRAAVVFMLDASR